jgi:hypothetical protein
MYARGKRRVGPGRCGASTRWGRVTAVIAAAALPLTAGVVDALPAAAAARPAAGGGYAVTATIPVGFEPEYVTEDPATHTVYVSQDGASGSVAAIDEVTKAPATRTAHDARTERAPYRDRVSEGSTEGGLGLAVVAGEFVGIGEAELAAVVGDPGGEAGLPG